MASRLDDLEARLSQSRPSPEAPGHGPSAPAISLYRLGLSSLEELRSNLTLQNIGEPDLTRLLEGALLERRRVVLDAFRDAIIAAFLREELTLLDLRKLLIALPIPTEHLEQELAIAQARRRLPKSPA